MQQRDNRDQVHLSVAHRHAEGKVTYSATGENFLLAAVLVGIVFDFV
jgi:hypothetical protein